MQRKHGCKMDGMLGANTQETVALWKNTNKQAKKRGRRTGRRERDNKDTRKRRPGTTRERQERDDLGDTTPLLGCWFEGSKWSRTTSKLQLSTAAPQLRLRNLFHVLMPSKCWAGGWRKGWREWSGGSASIFMDPHA